MSPYVNSRNPLVINAGELRHVILIQQPSSTQRDEAGQSSSVWEQVLRTRAKIEGTSSRTFKESFSNNALASQSTVCVTLRWPGSTINIKPSQRVIFGDNTYLIQAVDNVLRRNRVLVLACISIDGDSN